MSVVKETIELKFTDQDGDKLRLDNYHDLDRGIVCSLEIKTPWSGGWQAIFVQENHIEDLIAFLQARQRAYDQERWKAQERQRRVLSSSLEARTILGRADQGADV